MKTGVWVFVAAVLEVAFAMGRAGAGDPVGGKKLIEWGWDEPDTKFIRENVERMEQLPFDGFVFHLLGAKGENLSWQTWGKKKLAMEDYRSAVEDLRAAKFGRLTERFLRVNVTPGDVDWFDDAAWAVVEQNFGVGAKVAREAGCRGFMFDVEQYEKAPFDYGQQAHRDTKGFDEYRGKVRQRGREWMRAVNREFADITILLTFGYSIAQPKGKAKNRAEAHYGLLADFLDGMLEACTEGTRIVDAWESSYAYKRHEQFEQAKETITKKAVAWTEVPERYRQHVRAGFGIWMDEDWRKKGWDVGEFSKNHFTPAEFEYAVHCALRLSDEYVWIYTEQPRWWTRERLPGAYVEALAGARKPHEIDDAKARR